MRAARLPHLRQVCEAQRAAQPVGKALGRPQVQHPPTCKQQHLEGEAGWREAGALTARSAYVGLGFTNAIYLAGYG